MFFANKNFNKLFTTFKIVILKKYCVNIQIETKCYIIYNKKHLNRFNCRELKLFSVTIILFWKIHYKTYNIENP